MAPAASVSALPSRMKKLVPNASHPRCASRWTTGIEVRRGSTCMLALCWVYQPRCGWDGAERRLSSKARVTVDDEAMQYEKKTQLEHVLHRPDVYVGSMEETERQMLVFDMKARKVEFRAIKYIPGLLKLFDEIIVNAADNKVRDPTMNRIDVKIDEKNGVVSIWNNGKGIPIIRHAQYQDIYVPELVMGNLLAGSNFDDSKKRLGGGRHGYGAKLTNIFSTTFTVETADTIRKLRYRQTWRDNMSTCEPAVITPLGDETKDFTEITFAVDLRRFSRKTKLDKDIVALWARRVLDVAGCNPGVRCSLNGKPVRVKGTADLAHKYLSAIEATRRAEPDAKADRAGSIVELADASGRWSAAIAAGGSGLLNSVSYVNSIWTARGGTHVKYIADKVIEQILGHIKKNHKDLDVTDRQVRAHLWVCLAASVENPSFDSQSKELLTTSPEAFGSKFILRPADIRKIINHTGLVARVVQAAEGKMGRDLDKSTAAVAKRASSGKRLLIPKLEDANWAGTSKGHECTLILTEGDSAKALAVSGLSVLGRDRYGVFPLKGKLLNVREASHGQVRDNVEFTAIKTILGLQHGSSYHKDRDVGDKAFRSLRYGRVMLMTDQDHDGSHIKGLFFNMIHHFWPELLQRNDFICEFVTPIVKCFARQPAAAPPARAANAGSKGKGAAGSGDGVAAEGRQEKAFFTLQEFSAWWERLGGAEKSRWRVKYYKGLGTSSATEGKEYFADLAQHKLDMTHKGASDDDALQLAFSGNADRRKEWLLAHVASMEASRSTLDVVDHSASQLRYFDFVHKELIQFSYAHVRRSIPSVIDGFKPGNRKVGFFG
jgi:DNA topoisomerase-2